MKLVILITLLVANSLWATQALTHRNLTTPTGWWWKTNQTIDQIKSFGLSNGARVIDLEKMPGANTFAAIFVKNQGLYSAQRWWIGSGTKTQVQSFLSGLSRNNTPGRLIDLEPLGNGRFAFVAVQNSGSLNKKWWWYVGLSSDQMKAKINEHKGRIVSLESYTQSGQTHYAFVLVARQGEDNSGWWYYRNISYTDLKEKISTHKAQLTDLDRLPNGNFDVVLESRTNHSWWWHVNLSSGQVSELLAQTNSRLVDIEPFNLNGNIRYAVVTVDNSNALERRVRNFYSPLAPGAQRGFYLKQVGGPVLASVRERTKFVPASSLKALYHFTALQRVKNGQLNLTSVNRPLCGPDNASNSPIMPGSGSCPFSIAKCEATVTNQSLQTLLTRMMVNSNNRHTQSVRELIGQNTINQVASSLNMTDTLVRERIGCGVNVCLDGQSRERPCSSSTGAKVDNGYRGTPLLGNSTSLRDFGRLYEASLNLNQLGDQRDNFFNFMINDSNVSNGWPELVAGQENSTVNLSSSDLTDFRSRIRYAWKGGSYSNSNTSHFTQAGWIRLPVKSGNRILSRDYVYGVFQNAGPGNQSSVTTNVSQELLREEIKKAMNTWK